MRLAVLVLAACGPGIPTPTTPRWDLHESTLAVVRDAIGNADKLGKLLRGSIDTGGLWFASADCESFTKPGTIAAPQLSTFARCLADLPLQPSTRAHYLDDLVLLTYAPGFEIEARVANDANGARLAYIGFVGKRDTADTRPTIAPHILASLWTSGNRDVHAPKQSTWALVCLDDTGAIETIDPYATSTFEDLDATVAELATWKFRPFVVAGQPMPVCAVVMFGDRPQAKMPPPPPMPRARRPAIMFADIESHRVAGDKNPRPDNTPDVPLIRMTFRVCIDERGQVDWTETIRSSNYPDVDRQMITKLGMWRFRPFVHGTSAVPICAMTMLARTRTVR